MKIHKITVNNFKAIKDQEIVLDGASAIITGKNNSGKTSLLSGLMERMKSRKPELIVTQGENKGFYHMELTDGARIEWEFTNKSEKMAFVTPDGFKQTTAVIGSFGERYFGSTFNIDKFLSSGSSVQSKILQDIVGLDFDSLDKQYSEIYEKRTSVNRLLKELRAEKRQRPEMVEYIDPAPVEKELDEATDKLDEYAAAQREIERYEIMLRDLQQDLQGTEFEVLFNWVEARSFINTLPLPEKPDISALRQELQRIQTNNILFGAYREKLKSYVAWVAEGTKLANESQALNDRLSEIKETREEMLQKANLPDGFEFTDEGLMYDGLPFTSEQISTSVKYIAALKIGAMTLGELQSLHFDASPLDNVSLGEIMDWAEFNGYQLLIERPDYDAGDITYEIIDRKVPL